MQCEESTLDLATSTGPLASPLSDAFPTGPANSKVATAAVDAARSMTQDNVDDSSSTDTKSPLSWLAAHLLRSGIDEQLVKVCESKLIIKEGFVSEADFAELPPSDVDATYLREIGIIARGVQVRIIRLHRELYAQYTPPSTPSPLLISPIELSTKGTTSHRSSTGIYGIKYTNKYC